MATERNQPEGTEPGQPLPLTYDRLSRTSQRHLDRAMGQLGRTAKKSFLDTTRPARDRAAAVTADETADPKARRAAGAAVAKWQAVQTHGTSGRTIRMADAVSARAELLDDALDRARRHGHTAPYGAMWYPEHNRDITTAAHAHGFEPADAIAASAVMSPQNSPDNEKASVIAHMSALTRHTVTVTPELHQAIKRESGGTVGLDAHIGRTVAIGDLAPSQVAWLSHTKVRPHVTTGADLPEMGKGGGKTQIARAVEVLSGTLHRDQAINPHTAPKVATYSYTIQASQFGSGQHAEYVHRWDHLTTQHPGQTRIDTGHGTDETGMLRPARSVQDTWMNSVSHPQPNIVAPGTHANIAKTIASEQGAYLGSKYYTDRTGAKKPYADDPAVTPQELHHAWGQHADELNVRRLTDGRDFTMPGHASQATVWTEARIQGGKDPQYTASLRAHRDAMWQQHRSGGAGPGQLELFRAPTMSKTQFGDHLSAEHSQAAGKIREYSAQLRTGTSPYPREAIEAARSHWDAVAARSEPDMQAR